MGMAAQALAVTAPKTRPRMLAGTRSCNTVPMMGLIGPLARPSRASVPRTMGRVGKSASTQKRVPAKMNNAM